jgi:hypothetical protein
MKNKIALPRMPRKTKAGFKQQAYDLLGVNESEVVMVPQIEPLLKKANVLDKVWEYLETSGDDMARLLIAQKYKLSNKSMRSSVPFEAYCLAAKLDTKKVLGLIFAEVYSQNEQASGLMAAAAQPDVVRATIDAAKQPGGSRERDMMHKHSTFIPVPKTSITFVREAGRVVGGDDNSQTLTVLPPIEKTVRDLSDRFNEKLMNVPRIESPEVFEADFKEDSDED